MSGIVQWCFELRKLWRPWNGSQRARGKGQGEGQGRVPAVAGGQAPGLAWQPQRREQIHVLQLYHAFHDDQILQFIYNTCYDNAVQQRRFILIAMSSLPLKIGPWD